jgi:hypothetical protein
MPRQLRQNDPIASQARKSAAARRVGLNAQCDCGEARPEALISGMEPSICARCQRTRKGQSTIDEHHPAGRANDTMTVPIDVNDHRAELSVAQHDWPTPMLENPDGDPIIAAAASLQGFIDTLTYLLKLIDWIPGMLVALSGVVMRVLGPRWWKGTKFDREAPKR